MADEKYISRVQLTDGTVYAIKDNEARVALEELLETVVIFDCGTSTTNIDNVV